jgi:hypothetical protein
MTKELAQQLLKRKDVYLTSEGKKLLEEIANGSFTVTSGKWVFIVLLFATHLFFVTMSMMFFMPLLWIETKLLELHYLQLRILWNSRNFWNSIRKKTSLSPALNGSFLTTNTGWNNSLIWWREVRTSMLTPHETEKLRMILELLKEDSMYSRKQVDVSHRSRDERGRFLPNDFNKQGELLLELSDDDPPRQFKLVKVEGTYGTYIVKEKMKISDVLMTGGIVISLVIAYFA